MLSSFDYVLPEGLEHDMLVAEPSRIPCVQQSISFSKLPAEIRNIIYELTLPSKERDERLVITTPFTATMMCSALQPAITRATRQTRSECLAMFYANNEFAAYISRFDFGKLLRFVRCITSGPSPPRIRIHTHMMHNMDCCRGLLHLANEWSLLNFSSVHLEVRSAIWLGKNRVQSCRVITAIAFAEKYPPLHGKPNPELERKLAAKFSHGSDPILACFGRCECPATDPKLD